VTRDQMRPFIREILPTLVEILGSGNKVIQGFIDECITTIIQHSKFRHQLHEITDPIKNSKSKLLREACIEYIHQILIHWPPQYLEKDINLLKEILKVSLGDASLNARESARNAFILFHQTWPAHAATLLKDLDARTAKQLRNRIEEAGDFHRDKIVRRDLSQKKKETTEVKAAKSIQAVLRGALSRRRSSMGTSTPPDPEYENNKGHERSLSEVPASSAASYPPPPPLSVPQNGGSAPPSERARYGGKSPVIGTSRKNTLNEAFAEDTQIGRWSQQSNGSMKSRNSLAERRSSIEGRRSSLTERRGSGFSTASLMEFDFEKGQRVKVSLKNIDARGTVQYVGTTDFASGMWIGISLDTNNGKNDGSVNGIRYFSCTQNYGLFVRPNQVGLLDDSDSQAHHISEVANQTLSWHKEHCKEMFEALNEEINVLEYFEQLCQQTPSSEQVHAYLKTLEAMIERRNALCKSLHGNLQIIKEQLDPSRTSES